MMTEQQNIDTKRL